MTKKEYIQAHPKSYLSQALMSCNWPDKTRIEIIGGLDTPQDKRSNLYKALQRNNIQDYIRGGHRQRGTEGWWFAVRVT